MTDWDEAGFQPPTFLSLDNPLNLLSHGRIVSAELFVAECLVVLNTLTGH